MSLQWLDCSAEISAKVDTGDPRRLAVHLISEQQRSKPKVPKDLRGDWKGHWLEAFVLTYDHGYSAHSA